MTPSVVAIVAAYNEADVIAHSVADLIRQGVHVYFLDDGSTDGTVAAVEPFLGRGVVRIERLQEPSDSRGAFDWTRILHRKAEIARSFDADWFIHHDADEFRETPWADVDLAEGIGAVDALGYNAIDALSLDFWPTNDRFEPGTDVRSALTYYSPSAPHDRFQIRCWKKTEHLVDLAGSGGHDAMFPDRRVFPIRFLLRHYPVRSQSHGERKIFGERIPRYSPAERNRGWHVQYDSLVKGASFVRDASSLIPYDPFAIRIQLALDHRDVETIRQQLETEVAAHADARHLLDDNRREVARLRVALADLDSRHTRDLASYQRAVDDLTRQIDAFHASWTWRWSAPARALYRLLTGRTS